MSTTANDGDCPVSEKESLVSSFGHKYVYAWATICCLKIPKVRFMDMVVKRSHSSIWY